jgi:hypothetical protein
MRKCIVCEKSSIFAYRIKDVEATFCPDHIPKRQKRIKILVKCF